MMWVVVVVAVVAAVVMVVSIAGALLPVGHTATRSARFSSPPQRVFDAVLEMVRAEKRYPLQVVESRPPERLVTKIADPKLPFGGTWTYQIAPRTAARS